MGKDIKIRDLLVLTFFTLLFFLSGAYKAVQSINITFYGEETIATVTEIKPLPGIKRRQVIYEYKNKNGLLFQSSEKMHRRSWFYPFLKKGDHFKVLYNKDDHNVVIIKSFLVQWGLPSALLFFSFLCGYFILPASRKI